MAHMEHEKRYLRDFIRDFACGGVAGAMTGFVVGSPEYIKVKIQITPRKHLQSTLKNLQTWKNAVKNVPFFSAMFASTCAIEFSVNERIKKEYGTVPGVISSATSGGLWLVAADHTMFVRDRLKSSAFDALKRNRGLRLLTGFSPMVVREVVFITSVMHLGPAVGKAMQRNHLFGDSRSEDFYSTAGRLTAGVPMSLLSQPFDCLAREMQKHLAHTEETPRLLPTTMRMLQERILLRGVVPRCFLATVGGAMVGYVFDRTTRLF